ncbi:hypothetical protein VP417E501_P0028 [Vibrio phage 417E50-1]|nr:hypothetical protein VP417E501_P0028 [Vibrio phage 417E50-1]
MSCSRFILNSASISSACACSLVFCYSQPSRIA